MSFTYIYDLTTRTIVCDSLTKEEDFSYKVAGDIFNDNIEIQDIYTLIKEGKKLKLEGEFNLLIDDDESIVFTNDELGCIKWFYCFHENKLIISNDFWSIVKETKVTSSDINAEALYEILLLGMPLENKTWINGIHVFPRGVIASLNKLTDKWSIVEEYSIHYSESMNDERKAYSMIDSSLTKTVEKIVCLNPNKHFLFSTSGGLDSRFPLLYSEYFPNKASFLIGRNDGVGLAFDYANAKLLASHYDIDLELIDPFSQSLDEKAQLDVLRNPIGHGNLFKALDVKAFIQEPQNTILITGAHGGLIGGRKMNQTLLSSKNDQELGKNMFYTYSLIKELNNYNQTNIDSFIIKLKKLVLLLKGEEPSSLNIPIDDEVQKFIATAPLIPKVYKRKMIDKFTQYFMNNQGSTLTKIMRYHLLRHSIRGMFESMLGQVKSYTIYTYYIYSISKDWSIHFLYDRYIMQSFLKFKDTFSSKVSLQTYKSSFGIRSNRFNTLFRLLKLKSRKLAIDYNSWWNHDESKSFVRKTMKKQSSFYAYFSKKEVDEYLFTNSRYSQTKETLVKLKLLVDYLDELEVNEHQDPYISNEKY